MKDAKGHGSNGQGSAMAGAPAEDQAVANVLGQGHPKSQPVPIHNGATGLAAQPWLARLNWVLAG